MRLKLWHKFALALIVTSALTLLAALYFSQQSFKRGFLEYLNAQERGRVEYLGEQLRLDYERNQGWSFISQDDRQWHDYLRDTFDSARRKGLFADIHADRPRHDQRPPRPEDFPPPARDQRPPPRPDDRPPPPIDQRRPPRSDDNRPPPPRDPPPPRNEFSTPSDSGQDRRPPPAPPPPPPPPRRNNRPLLKVGLLDPDGKIIAGGIDEFGNNARYPLRVGNNLVGTLVVKSVEQFSSQAEQEFVSEQNRAFLQIAVLAWLLISLLAWLFGRMINARIKPLSKMADQLTSGQFDQTIEKISHDELGELAADLNQLANTLGQNRSARQRWIADISHELRTPLSVLRGELEALEDGIRPLEQGAVDSLQKEVSRLTQLVEDLYQLSMADVGALSYQFERIDLGEMLSDDLAAMQSRFGARDITTQLDFDHTQEYIISGDANRLSQLFKNLMQNSLRYTDAPGRLKVSLKRCHLGKQPAIQINWADSAPGVPESDLANIFNRMTRVEASRNRATGGAGLGLAIVQEIVNAHQGTVEARPSVLGGLDIEIILPMEAESE